jgi:hypothetical protein
MKQSYNKASHQNPKTAAFAQLLAALYLQGIQALKFKRTKRDTHFNLTVF